ncbi:hypothetical protein FRC19_000002 [Serendipita sp. 401]|nr:hypothetical protein FRC19_000002 [Serendipita sp. 401]
MDLILWHTILIALFAMSVNASVLPDPKLLSRAVNRRKKTLSTVLILLLVFAVVFILIGLGTIIYLCKRREERKKKIKPEEISAHEEPFLPPRGAGAVGGPGAQGAGGGGGGSTGSRPVSRIAYDGDWWEPPSQEGSRRSSNRYSGVPQVPPQSSINRHSGADYNNNNHNNNLNVPTVGSVNSHHQQRHSAYSLTPSRLSRVPPVEEPTDRPFQIPLPPPSAPPSSNTHSTITKNTNNNAPVPAPAPARIPSPIITNPFVSAPTSVDSHSQNHASLHHVLTQPYAIQSIPPPPPIGPPGSSGSSGPIPNTNPFNNNNNNRHVNFSPPPVPPSSYHQNVQLPYLVPQQTGTSIYSTINPYEPTAMTKSTAGH